MKEKYYTVTKGNVRKRNLLFLFAIIFGLLTLFYDVNNVYTKDNEHVMAGVSESLIRFHVIANSDSAEDQAIKIKVKDEVIKSMQVLLKDSKSIDESREILLSNSEEIKTLAEAVIQRNGFSNPVTIALQDQTFPLKEYGDVVLPPGKYEALVIRIGAAEGKNWWCILFPPLCFVDATHGVIDENSKVALRKVLTDEEYSAIVMSKDQAVNFKVKSKLVEWLEERQDTLLKDTLFAQMFQ